MDELTSITREDGYYSVRGPHGERHKTGDLRQAREIAERLIHRFITRERTIGGMEATDGAGDV